MPERKPKVIIIDDEADIRHLLTMTLIQMNLDVISCKDLTEAKDALKKDIYDFCLTDLKLPDGDGLEMVSFCRLNYPNMPIAVITAYSSTEKAIEAMKLGAFDFLSKPIDLSHLRQLLKHAFKFSQREQIAQKETIYKVLTGNDKYAADLLSQIAKVKSSQAPVVIEGEPGTEKEALAHIIHQQSSRSEQKIMILDLEAHPEETHEQVLFAAKEEEHNILLQANQGTLVINNIQRLSKPLQKRFLQCIEDKAFVESSSFDTLPLDIRLIVCTDTPLDTLFRNELLREDLYFRINVINLSIPSLRQRKGALPAIADAYLQDINCDKKLSQLAIEKLEAHDFPYNYRELENILFKATTLASGNFIEESDLVLIKPMNHSSPTNKSLISERGDKPLDQYLEEIEKAEIEKALEKTRWNRTEAAKILKVSFRTIRYKMKKLGIQ
ncbi:two-component system response regulator PilR [Kangiella japonica]|uniref:Two-component system response regulator PilR n=1 Tax=Kangiella japonica TaxID=647384 RepID=A0ABN0SSU8_9GAMM